MESIIGSNDQYLNPYEMSIKYNCSSRLVRRFGKEHGVPCIEDRSRHIVYHFYPEYEQLFANRETKTIKSCYQKICIIQHDPTPTLLLFRSYRQAFLYINRHGAKSLHFIVGSRQFKGHLKKIPEEDQRAIADFVARTGVSTSLYLWSANASTPLHCFNSKETLPYAELVTEFFLCRNHRFTITKQQDKEIDSEFCKRIYKDNEGEYQMTLSEIESYILPKKA